jgi:hypothetical protein
MKKVYIIFTFAVALIAGGWLLKVNIILGAIASGIFARILGNLSKGLK